MRKSTIVSKISQPYAEALFQAAEANNLVESISQDLTFLSNSFENDTQLNQFLTSPTFQVIEKKEAIKKLFSDKIHPFTINFVSLLLDKNRISNFYEIAEKFQELVLKTNKVLLAKVITAVEFSTEQKKLVGDMIAKQTGASKVDLEFQINSRLIGGFVIYIGSQVIDASLISQIFRIRNSLNI
uniref:ATP synthase F1 delta subunit n=1 Tax=Glaucocystis sp. BBH TaxID=2023628 RepID=A0A3G1IUZ2_9EUKA|nr:ATP synthase F1 delta subunit [Glaucocystis sp. BBH]